MIINLRYHIASLVAVFLALGIGVIIGSTMLGGQLDTVLAQQHDRLYDELKQNMKLMKAENLAVQKQVNEYKQAVTLSNGFEKSILPNLVSGKLAGKKIAVIDIDSLGSTKPQNTNEEWANSLSIAGAEVTSITRIYSEVLQKADLNKLLATKLMLRDNSFGAVLSGIGEEISGYLENGNNEENIDYLRSSGIVNTSGDYNQKVDTLLLVATNHKEDLSRCIQFDLPLIKRLQAQKLLVVVAEKGNTGQSFAGNYKRLKVHSVSNFETVPGQVELIKTISSLSE